MCHAPVHRLCQAAGEKNNEWSATVEVKLLCPACHPDCSPAGVAHDATVPTGSAEEEGSAAVGCATAANVSAPAPAAARKRNKGGRPKGSTAADMRAERQNRKKAVNWVVKTYLKKQGVAAKQKKRLVGGTLQKIVDLAKVKFKLKGNFAVPKQTISNRKLTKRLEVWHPGFQSPLLIPEIALHAYIITAWQLNCPLSVSNVKALMNSLIEGSKYEREMIKLKMKLDIYK